MPRFTRQLAQTPPAFVYPMLPPDENNSVPVNPPYDTFRPSLDEQRRAQLRELDELRRLDPRGLLRDMTPLLLRLPRSPLGSTRETGESPATISAQDEPYAFNHFYNPHLGRINTFTQEELQAANDIANEFEIDPDTFSEDSSDGHSDDEGGPSFPVNELYSPGIYTPLSTCSHTASSMDNSDNPFANWEPRSQLSLPFSASSWQSRSSDQSSNPEHQLETVLTSTTKPIPIPKKRDTFKWHD